MPAASPSDLATNSRKLIASVPGLEIIEGKHYAITGDNAAGKTLLTETLCRCPVAGGIRYIPFRDTYGPADGSYYLQKRWNRQDIEEEFTPTVRVELDRAYGAALAAAERERASGGAALSPGEMSALRERLYGLFGIEELLDRFTISISSGELRKYQITRALFSMPRRLVLDNPFIGLDEASRASFSALLDTVAASFETTVVLVMPDRRVMPSCITDIVNIDSPAVRPVLTPEKRRSILELPAAALDGFYPQTPGAEIVRCNGVSIRYDGTTILDRLDWVVREGEKWVISGPNGSGKSTLLSLVCADNPQSYACDIELFSHRRGSGESIWEIKRHIGYVSPEMHRAYRKSIPAIKIVASGLFDTVGLAFKPTPEQYDCCRFWMGIFGIEDLEQRDYMTLSSGEQRLCLLARAFVKDPELLVLDEPLHGLDPGRSAMVLDIVETFMQRPRKTLLFVSHFLSERPSCIDRELKL